ncbi:hypothetical protein TESG_05753 [Trichophyton tonsurans CBS 112818]|uniref:Uncharacterized protein n=1 Tax=Trichophyton tonsurans (strain CBS 112818) TaxID=647933 RepID=F2S475_TRIT1|nr:hypothetical protein TESG_05753 [Trichophyton tonsurans CBS 112818]
MAKTQETKSPATKSRGPSHRITKYKSAKSRLAIFRKIQSKAARSRKQEREDEPRAQEPPSKTIPGIASPSASDYSPARPPNTTLPVPKHIGPRRDSPDPPLRYIQPKEIENKTGNLVLFFNTVKLMEGVLGRYVSCQYPPFVCDPLTTMNSYESATYDTVFANAQHSPAFPFFSLHCYFLYDNTHKSPGNPQ